jgi:hypothetical protein
MGYSQCRFSELSAIIDRNYSRLHPKGRPREAGRGANVSYYLIHTTYPILFIAVLARQLCLPIPAMLFLLSGGALAGSGKLSFEEPPRAARVLTIAMFIDSCATSISTRILAGAFKLTPIKGEMKAAPHCYTRSARSSSLPISRF